MTEDLKRLLVRIDGVEYKVLIDTKRWERSTKPYLLDCDHEVEELGEFIGHPEVTDDLLSDLVESSDR